MYSLSEIEDDIEVLLNPLERRMKAFEWASCNLTQASLSYYSEEFELKTPEGDDFTKQLTNNYSNLKFYNFDFSNYNSIPLSSKDAYELLINIFEIYCDKFESPFSFNEMKDVTASFFLMKKREDIVIIEGSGFIMEGKSAFFSNSEYVSLLLESLSHSKRVSLDINMQNTIVIPEGDELWRVFKKDTKTPLLDTSYHVHIKFLWFYSVMKSFIDAGENLSSIKCIVLDRASIDHDFFDWIFEGRSDIICSFSKFFRSLINIKFSRPQYISMLFEKLPPWPLSNKVKREFEYQNYKTKSQLHLLCNAFYGLRSLIFSNNNNLSELLFSEIENSIFLNASSSKQTLKRASECAKYIAKFFLEIPMYVHYWADERLNIRWNSPTYFISSPLPLCTLLDSIDTESSVMKARFGEKIVEFLYYKDLLTFDLLDNSFQMIAAIINRIVPITYKIHKFNKKVTSKLFIIASDGYLSQGKTTALNNKINEKGPLRNYEYIIREQDYEWRKNDNYIMKNHQELLMYYLLADLYQVYADQGN